ncbi:MAG: DUF5655 domain-containing protein [Anaerolineaceae bacterium]|nr:DUF5655 domain-containing protein [Anaerolineaceae bacterium]
MSEVQIFHATLDGARELEATPFHRERDLQRFIEFHLDDLFGIEFLDTEHSTGPHDKQRIDSLGIDARGRPVVIEYKLRSDKNIINQGLGYLDWLEKHPESIELLALKKLGPDKAQRVDLKRPRLLCIAGAFTRNDIATAENSKATVELVRYCRYGDTSLLLEWVHGRRTAPKTETEEKTPGPDQEDQQPGQPDFSIHVRWNKADTELRQLFMELHTFLVALGEDVRVVPVQQYISFKRKQNAVDVFLQTGKRRLRCWLRLNPDSVRLQQGFTRDVTNIGHNSPNNLELNISSQADLKRAEPLLKRSYEEAG